MATNVPPHNPEEVCQAAVRVLDALLEEKQLSSRELCRTIKGPDFPTGGQIVSTTVDHILRGVLNVLDRVVDLSSGLLGAALRAASQREQQAQHAGEQHPREHDVPPLQAHTGLSIGTQRFGLLVVIKTHLNYLLPGNALTAQVAAALAAVGGCQSKRRAARRTRPRAGRAGAPFRAGCAVARAARGMGGEL
jgi:hypothetical protein